MTLRAAFRALVGAYLRQEKGRTLLTLLGVALGVAVLVAIDLANESAVASFKRTVADVAGSAQLTVRGNGVGLSGDVVARLRATPGVESVAPLISGNASFSPADGGTTETLLLLGVDLLQSEERGSELVRELRFRLEEGRDIASFLGDPSVLVFTERFATRHGLQLGAKVPLIIAGKERLFTVGGLIDAGPFTETLDGNILACDIGIADILLARQGRVDRADVTVQEGTAVEDVQARLVATLPGSLLVERPEARNSQVDEMLAAFRFNLRALGHISILVGAFLIYNTMSIAVVRRRSAIGTLRAIGLSRGRVRAVFLLEGAAFGLLGSVLGIALGIVMAKGMLGTVSQAISINFVQTSAQSIAPSPWIFAMALALGVGGSLLAALLPAQEAATTPPANTMRQGTQESGGGRTGWALAGGALAAAGGTALLLREPAPGLPIAGYVASTLWMLAFVLWSRPALHAATAVLRRPFARLFGAEGLLAVSSTQAALGRATVAICGLLVSVAMTVAVGVMVSSFRGTVVRWMEQVLVANLYITPALANGGSRPDPFPAAVADALRGMEGVAAVDAFRGRQFQLNGRPAWLGAGELDAVRFSNTMVDGRSAQEVMKAAKANGEAIISEALARKHRLQVGDRIPIPTPAGDVPVRIAAVYYDYSSEQGYVIIDRTLYLKHFDDPMIDSIAVYLESGADRQALRARIRDTIARVPGAPPVVVRANDDLRAFALQAFEQTFAVTYLLQAIALLVSILGVTTTLLAQILDRRHEIATLRYLGASQRRVARVVVLESALIGLVGTVLGVGAGLVLSWILTRVIMLQSFGWTIAFNVPWGSVAQVCAVIFAATVAAALLPARQAARLGSGGTGQAGGR